MTSAEKYDYEPYLQKMLQRLQRNVRHLREEMKLTVYEAAQRAGIHWRHWQKVEAGESNATLDTIVRIANGLEIDVDELLGPQKPQVRGKPKIKRNRRTGKRTSVHVVRHRRERP
jgi:transcriptional regulator with XRE-family HTH domain